MGKDFFETMRVVRIGIFLSLLTILFGFVLGGLFGIMEDELKDHLANKATQVIDTVYKGDETAINRIVGRSWSYYQRAHIHANGLGVISLGIILLLMIMPVSVRLKSITAIMLSLGSLGYSSFWLFAGLKAPSVGSTEAAKNALGFLAIPSAGLCIIGVVIVMGVIAKTLFSNKNIPQT